MEYIFMGLLTMVGFGLILAYLGRGAVLGLATTLLCVGITVQVSPLLQSFWYLVFHGFNTVQETTEVFSTIYGGKMIHLLEYTEKIAMITACSLLLAMTCLIGKIGLFATIFTTFCFNIGWPLAYMANIYLY